MKVGAFAGVVASIPAAGIALLFLVFSGVLAVGADAGGGMIAFGFIFVLLVGGSVLYMVALCAVGGWLGNYVRYETDLLD